MVLVSMLLVLIILSACEPSDEPTPTDAPPPEPTATYTPEQEPAVGGRLVIAWGGEPDSGDIHEAGFHISQTFQQFIGSTLVTRDRNTNELIPYLAEGWTVSEDGLTLDFFLRDDVKFHHEGTPPLTAHEYAWTLDRAKEYLIPAAMLSAVDGVEAVDDYTLRFHLNAPGFTLIDNLTRPYFVPYNQKYTEEKGAAYGASPTGVGPFRLTEWIKGERIILERNPDFLWGPAYTQRRPPYIKTIEIRIMHDQLEMIACLETGECDLAWLNLRGEESPPQGLRLVEIPSVGTGEMIFLNNSKPPFDDPLVRQAFSLAVDRDALVKIELDGNGAPSHGPLTPAVYGYWPGVEKIGYSFDLERAKTLMAEAGWFDEDGDGILEKDGEPLSLTILTFPDPSPIQTSKLLQEMYERLGVRIEVSDKLGPQPYTGDFTMIVSSFGHHNADILFGLYHTSTIGSTNFCRISDPVLDEILDRIHYAPDEKSFFEASAEAQQVIVEQAPAVYLFRAHTQVAVNDRVRELTISPDNGRVEFFDTYLETTEP
jgi:peptide/nickel transport system substrate-binding protein